MHRVGLILLDQILFLHLVSSNSTVFQFSFPAIVAFVTPNAKKVLHLEFELTENLQLPRHVFPIIHTKDMLIEQFSAIKSVRKKMGYP